ncbi:MAG: SHOCT domain-containing protein [Bacillota bacterium]|nr:SHOCT domain-containing protein [Bacillota bacterium]
MGLFSKPIVSCSICGKTVGAKEKRWSTKDGYICSDCQKPFGILNGPRAFVNYTASEIKEMIEKRKHINTLLEKNRNLYNSFTASRIIENNIYIDDEKSQWYYKTKLGITDINGNIPVPIIFNFSDILEVYVSKGDKTISSTSSTRKVKGIRKAVVGGILAGSTGAMLGGMLARSETSTQGKELQTFYVNILIDGESEELSIPYQNEYSAEKVHHALANMIQDPVIPSTEEQVQFSSADEILKFKQLLDSGVITKEEFEAKKTQLLGL